MQSAVPSTSLHATQEHHLNRRLGLFDSTMIVAGSMIGSGIFIVSAEMSRQLGSAGWLLLSWLLTGLLTVCAALAYGELAAMTPKAGGQYVYLRDAWSPLCGFLYGWTLFLVIQTGTIAAVAVGFARYLGILWPAISESNYLIPPIHLSSSFAISLSTAQLVGILLIALLTWTNSLGIQYGKLVQNVFTSVKIGSLFAVIVLGLLFAILHSVTLRGNFLHAFEPHHYLAIAPGVSMQSAWGIVVALGVAQVGSLFSADAWNNVTFTAGEVKNPSRNLPLSLAMGTMLVIGLYICANLAYLAVLPLTQIQNAPSDRVAGAMLQTIFPVAGGLLVAIAIMISTFGCINGMVMSGARAYYAMARDGLFFRPAADLNKNSVPGKSLFIQGAWAAALLLFRTYDPSKRVYGNLYSNLLDYVISAALLFYILTIAGVFRLRKRLPNAERPYKAFGYPLLPALYIALAIVILAILFCYRSSTTLPGLLIVLLGVPAYIAFRRFRTADSTS